MVGSGLGSLYCAALLAKCGRKVLVLEQHYVAGGCLHVFEDKGKKYLLSGGVSIFSAGLTSRVRVWCDG